MKKITLFLFALFTFWQINAQVSSYNFSQTTGTYNEITGGTVLATATGNSYALSHDNEVYNVAGLPFTFTFTGIGYTGFNVSSNGFITFGATAPGVADYTPISGTAAYAGAISAWGGDLNGMFNLGGFTSEIRWEVVGSAPNREVVIQWKNNRPSPSTSTTNAAYLNFQIRLKETSNEIDIVYGPSGHAVGTTNISITRQVGLRGPNNTFPTNINNRLNGTGVSINSSTAGTANNSTQAYSSINATPGTHTDGKIYRWSPPSCPGPTNIVVSNVTTNSADFSWTAGGSEFDWEYLILPAGFEELESWMKTSEQNMAQLTKFLLNFTSPVDFAIAIAVIGGMAALGEEIFFRGIVQSLFERYIGNAHVAIWVSAAIFSFIHMQFY